MIVILDTAKGKAYNFKFRKEAAEFIGVSLPTLRGILAEPFYLYQTLIITLVNHEKILASNRELLKRHIEKIGQMEYLPNQHKTGNVPSNGSPTERPAQVDRPN